MACCRRASSPQAQRDLRDLTRYRTKVVQERSRAINRLQGVLERANIKLAAVAMDILGVSGHAILAALIQGHADPATMAALTGLMRDRHRRLLTRPLTHIDVLDAQIDALSVEITRGLGELEATTPAAPDPLESMAEGASPGDGELPDPPMRFAQAIAVRDTIAGVDQRGAELLVAE